MIQTSELLNFEDLDDRISDLTKLEIFSTETLEYLSEIHENSKRFDRDLSYNLVIRKNDLIGIISISIVDQKIGLLCASKADTVFHEKQEFVTKTVNSLLHWLWLFINSY